MSLPYPPLQLELTTPLISLHGANDDALEELLPVVRAGVATEPPPFDDPMSLYDDNPSREWRWLRGIWSARARVSPDFWRLCLVVRLDGRAVGMQDLIGQDFNDFGAVATFSWLAPEVRGRGIGREARAAILHLAFEGFGAREANSEAFVDNVPSNAVSKSLGYQPNGTTWATRKGVAAQLQRWTLTRASWQRSQRTDIAIAGVDTCRVAFGMPVPTS